MEDTIGKICLDCFETLPKSGKPNHSEWTVLSCIVQEFGTEMKVVALGTGSKCIGRSKMSERGDILNDSHAEIVCRRSFLRYIYSQLILKSSTIITFNADTQKFILNPNVKYHFFTTHVPCGDAAIFPKQCTDDFGNIIEDRNNEEVASKKIKLDEDTFRTGAKCLEGSEEVDSKLPGIKYHVTGVVRTKPGRGDATLSVSCSDKIAKWCHLGIQGALLDILLEKPIYLSSFTITSNNAVCKEALKRAFYGRLMHVPLENSYSQNIMVINQSSLKFNFAKDDKKQACPSSISWCAVTEKSIEVVVDGRRQGVTKKKLHTEASRVKISKLELFKTFLRVCDDRSIHLREDCKNNDLSYGSVKLLSKTYQKNWTILRQSFRNWTVKNHNLLNFLSNIT